jgi:chromate transporter
MADAPESIAQRLAELASTFLKLGVLSYGGAAMVGIMHVEIVERRRWLDNERYLEGVALVNMLPGPPAMELSIMIGYLRAGWPGGMLSGFCFMLPAFVQLLALTLAYSAYGSIGVIQDALFGIGAVVLAIFAAALYRLGRSTLTGGAPIAIAVAAGLAVAHTPLGIVTVLLLAACVAVALGHARIQGLSAALAVLVLFALGQWLHAPEEAVASTVAGTASVPAPALWEIGLFFFKVGAFTFGGALSMIALVQEHVVNQARWLTSREFLDGLALGQLTPGPTLMIAAYVGYKASGIAGAITGALAIFLPAFLLMLGLMPVLERFERLAWVKPAMRGISAAVIGCLVVTVWQLLPHAAPDIFALAILVAATAAALLWRVAPAILILAGAIAGLGVKMLT